MQRNIERIVLGWAMAGGLLIALVGAAGCAPSVCPVALAPVDVTPALDYEDLAFVLQKVVTDDGMLLPEALTKHADRLDLQLERLAVTGPTASPQLFTAADEELAYWYNARAAWAMKLAALCECPQKMDRGELTDRSFTLDGRQLSLAAIDEILTGYDDWRVLVASPGVALIRARLPETPFAAGDVRTRIAERISQFVDDPRRFEVDIARQRIYIPPVLWRFRERIIAGHDQRYGTRGTNLITALLEHTQGSAHRRLQDAIGYRVVSGHPSLLTAVLEQ